MLLGRSGFVIETYSCLSFPSRDRGQCCGGVRLGHRVKARVLTLGRVRCWCRAEECHQCDISVKPLRTPLGSYPGQDSRDIDELGAVRIRDRFVRPAIGDGPTPGKCGLLVRKTNPMIGVNVEGGSLRNDVARSTADPHYRGMFGGCVASGTQL